MAKKLTKVLFLFLVTALVAAFVATAAFAAENTTEFAGGEGTAESPYLISTKEHLNNVRKYLSAHFKMTADIEFSRSDFLYGGEFYDPATGGASGWIAIGTPDEPFRGTFDGDGHTITRLYQNISSDTAVYGGLFGYADGATIKNLGMIDSEISAISTSANGEDYDYVGGIVGQARNGVISNCYNTGNITGDVYVGGIVGYINRPHTTVDPSDVFYVEGCYNAGSITGAHSTGGVVGGFRSQPNAKITISKCYNVGDISCATYAGGIAGMPHTPNYTHKVDPCASIRDCYNLGGIKANYAGGIAGSQWCFVIIESCYNAGVVTGIEAGGITGSVAAYSTEFYETDVIITDCYYLDICKQGVGTPEQSSKGDAGTKCTINQMKRQSTFVGFDFETAWQMGDGNVFLLPTLRGVTYVEIPENTTEFAGGNGTGYAPYLISTKEQLNNVRNYLDAHFKMTADLVFTDADFAEGGAFYNDGAGWSPIGNRTNAFAGVFDGDGHTITGLYVNISTASSCFGGLFGYVSGASIKNLGMIDLEITVTATSGYSYAGGICGYGGNINNCYNTGNVSGNYYAGGICGYGGTINNCYNTGIVSGSYHSQGYAGGICGSGGTINNCYNMGNVCSSSNSWAFAGGICGSGSTVSSCYNTGIVSASGKAGSYAGGIMGKALGTTISNCYNVGSISGSYHAGGIIGDADYYVYIRNCYNTGSVSGKWAGGIAGEALDATISNCYYLDNVSQGVGSGTDTAVKCTTEELSYQGTFLGFNFANVWEMGSDAFWPYPQLVGMPMTFRTSTNFRATLTDAKVSCSYRAAADCTFTLTVAQYDTNGQMLAVKTATVSALAGVEQTRDFVFDAHDGARYKVFLADSVTHTALDACIPLG